MLRARNRLKQPSSSLAGPNHQKALLTYKRSKEKKNHGGALSHSLQMRSIRRMLKMRNTAKMRKLKELLMNQTNQPVYHLKNCQAAAAPGAANHEKGRRRAFRRHKQRYRTRRIQLRLDERKVWQFLLVGRKRGHMLHRSHKARHQQRNTGAG